MIKKNAIRIVRRIFGIEKSVDGEGVVRRMASRGSVDSRLIEIML